MGLFNGSTCSLDAGELETGPTKKDVQNVAWESNRKREKYVKIRSFTAVLGGFLSC